MKKIYIILFTFVSLSFFGQFPDWKYLSQSFGVENSAEYGPDIWVATQEGLIQYNKISGNKTYYDRTNSPLPDNFLTSLAIDGLGNKWIGTLSGLVKYDGSTWTVYTTTNSSLPNNDIRKIKCDINNNVWIGTGYINAGLIKFTGTTWSVYTTTNSAIPSNYINALCTQGSNVWLSVAGGLTKFDGTNWTSYNSSNSIISTSAMVLGLTADQIGNVWLMHTADVEKFNGTNTLTLYNSTNTNLNNSNLYSITTDTNNLVWVSCATSGTNLGGFKSFNGSTTWTDYNKTNTTLNTEGVYAMLINSTNKPVGFSNEGFMHTLTGPTTVNNINISKVDLPTRRVRHIAFDKTGYPIIGTLENPNKIGLCKYDFINTYTLTNYNDTSYQFCTDKNSNIFVKNRNTVYQYNGTTWSLIGGGPKYSIPVYVAGFPDLSQMVTDTAGGLWVDYLAAITINTITSSPIFHEGLAYYNGSTWATYCYTNSLMPDAYINDIKINKATNDVWLGTSVGLVKFDKTNWSVFTPTSASTPSQVATFDIDTLGNVWYNNGASGFIKFDGVNFTTITSPFTSAGGADICIDKGGTIWQRNGGSSLLGYDGLSWSAYTFSNAPWSSIGNSNHLTVDKFNNKWIGTTVGIFVYKQGGVYSLSNNGKEKELSKAEIIVYPNPTSEKFNIKLDKNYQNIELTLFNSIGQEVLKTNYYNTPIAELKNNLAKGVYIYSIKADNNTWSGKIIAE